MENGHRRINKRMSGTDVETLISREEAEEVKRFFDAYPCSKQVFRSTTSTVYTKRRDPRFRVRVIPLNEKKKQYRFMFTFVAVDSVFELILDGKLPALEMQIQDMIDVYASTHTEKFFDEVIQKLPDDVAEDCIYKMEDYLQGKYTKSGWLM